MIETRDLRVRYPGGARAALDGVSAHIEAGTLFAVLGPNGSGKSTLTRAILGAAPIESGQILLDGRAASAWKRRELARVFAAVPQSEAMPFPMTAREMVGMGRYAHLGPLQPEGPEDRRVIDAALARCDVADLADRLVQTLSGGELQRVRIARALAQEPRVLILDEPTASLDVRHEMAILELLASAVRDGLTVLLVTHHLDLAARYADRLLILDEGKVVAVGSPAEVLTPETLRAVYEWPLEVEVDRITGSPRVVPLSPGEGEAG